MITKAEITYTTPDGVEHKQVMDIAMHPIIELKSLNIDGVEVLLKQALLISEPS